MNKTKPKSPTELTEEDFRGLVGRANAGRPNAKRRLTKVLDERPDVWQKVGDLGAACRTPTGRGIGRRGSIGW